jgi:hypothetical protein
LNESILILQDFTQEEGILLLLASCPSCPSFFIVIAEIHEEDIHTDT